MTAIPKKTAKQRELLFHVVKRDVMPFWKSLLIRVIALVLAFLFCIIFRQRISIWLDRLYEQIRN